MTYFAFIKIVLDKQLSICHTTTMRDKRTGTRHLTTQLNQIVAVPQTEGEKMTRANHYQDLKKHNGKYCIIDGIKCRIVVREYNAIYPYEHKAISAYANALHSDVCFDLTMMDDISRIKNYQGGQFQLMEVR